MCNYPHKPDGFRLTSKFGDTPEFETLEQLSSYIKNRSLWFEQHPDMELIVRVGDKEWKASDWQLNA